MKCRLTYNKNREMCLEITPESDMEEIALRAWSDLFFPYTTKGAYILITTQEKNNDQ